MADWDPEKMNDQEDEIMDRSAVEKATEAMMKGRKKRKKMDHTLFFDDEMGFKKLLKDFPRVKFRGKGYEKEDLKLMLRNYRQWFSELLVEDNDLEELSNKARKVLFEKEKDENGKIKPNGTDPKEKLIELRCAYKNPKETDEATAAGAKAAGTLERKAISSTAASSLSEEQKRRIAENRQKALDKKRQKDAEDSTCKENSAAAAPESNGEVAISQPGSQPGELDMEVQWRIEQNRLKALEKKNQKEREASDAAPAKASTNFDDPFGMDDDFYPEDDFGWDGGLDE